MAERSSLEIVSEYAAALAASNTERMDALRGPEFELDFVYGDASASNPLSSEETKQIWPSWLVGFPEMDYKVTRTIAAEDVVVTQWVFTGTHSKPLENRYSNSPSLQVVEQSCSAECRSMRSMRVSFNAKPPTWI